MPDTTNRNWTYPAEGTKPYFTEIVTFFEEQDTDVQALWDALETTGGRKKAVIDYVDNTADPTGLEAVDARYLLDFTGSSHANWDGASAGDIVQFNGTIWEAESPQEGNIIYVDAENEDRQYVNDGTPAWESRPAANNYWTSTSNILSPVTAGDGFQINSTETGDDSIRLGTAGGIDIDAAGDVAVDTTAGGKFTVETTGSSGGAGGGNIELVAGGEYGYLILTADGSAGGIIMNSASTLDINASIDIDIDAVSAITIDSSAGAISIGSDSVAQPINIGTGAAARTITVGDSLTTQTKLSSVLVDINAGTGGIDIDATGALDIVSAGVNIQTSAGMAIDSTSGTIAIGSALSGSTTTSDIYIGGVSSGNTSIVSGTGAGAGSKIMIQSNSVATDSIHLHAQNGGIDIDSGLGIDIDATGEINIATSGGAIVLSDQYYTASTYDTPLVLSDSSAEWNDYETNFGEVSLLNALSQAAAASITPTLVTTATYTVLITDTHLLIDRSLVGECIITIPTAFIEAGYTLDIIDSGGNASLYDIIILTEGSETINGEPDALINGSYSSISLLGIDTNRLIVR